MKGAPVPTIALGRTKGYRLINSRLPAIHLFEDVANAADFDALYALQAMTNPRLNDAVGDLGQIKHDEIPWGIAGCSYAVAPFTHISPEGSRFSGGDYGMLYIADTMNTAIKEVAYHQQRYLANVEYAHFDRIVFRGLACTFTGNPVADATTLGREHEVFSPDDYSASQALGAQLRKDGCQAIQYFSARHAGAICWGLFTPAGVESMAQKSHLEMIWDGQRISDITIVIALGKR